MFPNDILLYSSIGAYSSCYQRGFGWKQIQKLTTKHLTELRKTCRRQGGRIIVVSNSGVKGTRGKPNEPTNLRSQVFTETEGTNKEPALDIVLRVYITRSSFMIPSSECKLCLRLCCLPDFGDPILLPDCLIKLWYGGVCP